MIAVFSPVASSYYCDGLFRQSLNGTGTGKNGSLYIMMNTSHCNLYMTRNLGTVSNPFCTLPGDLTEELMVCCTSNLIVILVTFKFPHRLQCEVFSIILVLVPVPVPFPHKFCLNKPRACSFKADGHSN